MNFVDQKPSVIIVSSSSTRPKSLIKLITRNSEIVELDPHRVTQAWQIDTKYYTAEVNLHGITDRYVRSEDFNSSVEAVIIHMDSNKETGLQDLQKWEVIEEECDPEVKLLVSNYCTDETKITRARAVDWCLKHGFELVELYPSADVKEEDDEIIKEKVGVNRIIEALQTHVWPNLEMKDCDREFKQKTTDSKQGNLEKDCSFGGGSLANDFLTDEGAEDFTELFAQLHMMKESIQTMPMRERKQCAEQMVTAFWRAIGGDEEEIAEL